jgi:amidase
MDPQSWRIDRRAFLLAAIAVGTRTYAAGARFDTLREWLVADPQAREAARQGCLDTIGAREDDVRAWVQVKPQPPLGAGPLIGIPFGVKDIIETQGLATEYGSPIYQGRIGTEDATIVRQLRRRGGVLLGKTQTVAFAYRDPSPTRNPRNLAHTPGGSSSGSAAAVAAGMVPFAIGTQTGGSTLRPASFCGVVGFKPTHGLLSVDGVLPLAPSLDTLGFFTQTADDMLALWSAMGQSTGRAQDVPIGVIEPMPAVDADMQIATADAVARLRNAGWQVRSIDIAPMVAKLADAYRTIVNYEGARVHRDRFERYGNRLGAIADLVRSGRQTSDAQYRDAMTYVRECRKKLAELYRVTPVILLPAAPGAAPLGLSSTGDARLNSPWTTVGTPAISVPMPVGNAMPLGVQLTAAHGQDAQLIHTARKVELLFGDRSR